MYLLGGSKIKNFSNFLDLDMVMIQFLEPLSLWNSSINDAV